MMGKKIQTIGRYQMAGQTLGKGAFARVELAIHSVTQIKVGIKLIDTRKFADYQARELFNREAKILSQMNHPNIIRMYETLKAGSLYCIVTEYAPGGELLGYVRSFKEERLTECQARPFVRQLVSAVNYMHERGVVHRDLKMENILLDEPKKNVKIIDFGLSNVCASGQLLKTHCGSPEYAAPELLSPKRGYGPEVDLWSLGIIIYALVTGRLPFWSPYADHGRKQKLLDQIEKGLTEKHEAVMKNLSIDCRHLIKQLVEPNPLHRIPLKEVMLHAWITRNGKTPFVAFKGHHRNHALKNMVSEKLSQLMKVDRAEIESTVAENKTHEMTTMYNLLMDDARKGTEYAELDHTLPITYVIAEQPKRSAEDNWNLIKNSIRPSKETETTTNHVSHTADRNGAPSLPNNNEGKQKNHTSRPNMLHLISADNALEEKRKQDALNDGMNTRLHRDAFTATARLNTRPPDFQSATSDLASDKNISTQNQAAENLQLRVQNEQQTKGNTNHCEQKRQHHRECSEGTIIGNLKREDSSKKRMPPLPPDRLNFKPTPKTNIVQEAGPQSQLQPQPQSRTQTNKLPRTHESNLNAKALADSENDYSDKSRSTVAKSPIQTKGSSKVFDGNSQHSSGIITFNDSTPIQHPYLRVRSCCVETNAFQAATDAASSVECNSSAAILSKSHNNSVNIAHSERKFSLDANTIDVIVAKLLAAAGKRPSILRRMLNDSSSVTTSARDSFLLTPRNHHRSKRSTPIQQSSPERLYRTNRLASPLGMRRARSCAPQAEDSIRENHEPRSASSQKSLHSTTTQTDVDRQRMDKSRGRRKQRHVRGKRKLKIAFLQHSPGSESFDADDEGDNERRYASCNLRRNKMEPQLCARCSCYSSSATLSNRQIASAGSPTTAHLYNGNGEIRYRTQKRSLLPSHELVLCGIKRDSLTPSVKKHVTLLQSHSQKSLVT